MHSKLNQHNSINTLLTVLLLSLFLLSCDKREAVSLSLDKTIIPNPESINRQPNILLIVADDMGLTDLGAFGSEIKTPNLDQIANNGIKLTNFHASAQCAPTRAILMSGHDNHTAGMGSMFGAHLIEGDYADRPGYERYLHPRVASLPERLKEAGYATYMTGKWHLGADDDKIPTARGFDKSFALMGGSANHMVMRRQGPRPPIYRENGKILKTLPDDFYSTNTHTEKMIEFIQSDRPKNKPFFAYLALTSPHWPLQVPEEYKNLYSGRYDAGYDELRAERLKRAEQLGVIPEVDPKLFDLIGKKWSELTPEEQQYSARTMELYAAMVTNMDDNIAKLTTYLKEIGELDNTFIFFMSDNGAESDSLDNPTFGNAINNNAYYDNSYNNIGSANSWIYYGPGWAQASMAPYRMFKGSLAQGGTLVSAFAYHPTLSNSATSNDQRLSVKDVMPTFLELADAQFNPSEYQGRTVLPIQGRSFTSVLQGDAESIYSQADIIASEVHGQRALQRGDWKILWEQKMVNIAWYEEEPNDWKTWKLYNLQDDPTEEFDQSHQKPELRAELIALWDQFAADNNIKVDITPIIPGN